MDKLINDPIVQGNEDMMNWPSPTYRTPEMGGHTPPKTAKITYQLSQSFDIW